MQRATPIQTRQSLQIVEELKKAGMRFVPIPVLDDEDFEKLTTELKKKLEKIEQFARKP